MNFDLWLFECNWMFPKIVFDENAVFNKQPNTWIHSMRLFKYISTDTHLFEWIWHLWFWGGYLFLFLLLWNCLGPFFGYFFELVSFISRHVWNGLLSIEITTKIPDSIGIYIRFNHFFYRNCWNMHGKQSFGILISTWYIFFWFFFCVWFLFLAMS